VTAVPCPIPTHAGSKVTADGTHRAKSGPRRLFLCTPAGYEQHRFTVLLELADERPTAQYAPPPRCPVHGRKGRVVRDGCYGRPEERWRQRYRCYLKLPYAGDDPYVKTLTRKGWHSFTPPLTREHIHVGEVHCEECDELRGVHHGDERVARAQSWNLRLVAEGLEKLSAGQSYTDVGTWAWRSTARCRTRPAALSSQLRRKQAALKRWRAAARAAEEAGRPAPPMPTTASAPVTITTAVAVRRRRVDAAGKVLPPRSRKPRTREANNRWHIAADWCEMYAPVLWQPLHERLLAQERAEHARRAALAPAERLADGRPSVLLLDDQPVNTKALNDGTGRKVSRRSYFVLGAASIEWPPGPGAPEPDDRYTRLRLLRAYPDNTATAWKLLFHELGYRTGVYEPEFVLADAGTGLGKAVAEYLPHAVFIPSLWHVSEAVIEALEKTPGTMRMTDDGRELHPELIEHVAWLSTLRIQTMTIAQWRGWWNDLDTLLTRLGLPYERVARRRDNYREAIEKMLPAVQANPGVPIATGGLETVLRGSVKRMLTGRSHGFANIERTNSLCDLLVCRDHGVFTPLSGVLAALRAEAKRCGGWASAPRESADPQPPMPATYSSLRDRDLVVSLAKARGIR
jgi:hypothetical protein